MCLYRLRSTGASPYPPCDEGAAPMPAPTNGEHTMGRLRLTATRLTTVIAAVTVVAVAVSVPASASVAQTKTQVVRSLLSGAQIGDGWHKTAGSDGTAGEVGGCLTGTSAPAGLRFTATRSYQYLTTPAAADETVYAFGTATSARRDFNKSTRLFDSCSSFTIDGSTWTVARMPVAAIADQTARYRLNGSVPSAAGKVPVVLFVVAARYGRQSVVTTLGVGSTLTSAQRTEFAKASVRLCRMATAKVADRLGR